jgi:Skp family chaperone for outer membrane proteins
MPVTAKLSKLFYDRLGEQVANELVDWFNQVDATYRADLRELNELNFARFDAKLEQRLAELHAKLDSKIDRVTTELDAKFDSKIDRVTTELHAKFDSKIDRVAAELHAKIDRVAAAADARMDARVSDLHAVLERRLGDQTRWLFVAWASLLIAIMGLWLRG